MLLLLTGGMQGVVLTSAPVLSSYLADTEASPGCCCAAYGSCECVGCCGNPEETEVEYNIYTENILVSIRCKGGPDQHNGFPVFPSVFGAKSELTGLLNSPILFHMSIKRKQCPIKIKEVSKPNEIELKLK